MKKEELFQIQEKASHGLSIGKFNIFWFNYDFLKVQPQSLQVERIDFTLNPETTFDK